METKSIKYLMFFAVVTLILTPSSLYAQPFNTYYVRADGGTLTQCNGLYDAPYTGSNQNCAVNHIYWLLPIEGGGASTVLQGGDTVIIGPGSYELGWNGPNHPNTSKCYTAWPYGCNMSAIPSGPDPSNPTKILGKGWDSGCSNPPELWGSERAKHLISLKGSNNVELRCLDLTDHESCIEFQGSIGCPRGSVPTGSWAGGGISASDSKNVLIENLNIHGMAGYGVEAGRIEDWEIRDTVIRGNGFVGWDGDIGSNSSNNGYLKFIRTTIEYSGCSETYPITQTGSAGIKNCWSQGQGGYGDGLGTETTNGDWYFEDVNFSHNVSDGLDLLYADQSGSVKIVRGRFEGNAGNQIKSAFDTTIEDAKVIGNCAYFTEYGIHPGIVWDGGSSRPPWSGNCRALGNSVVFEIKKPGQTFEIVSSTITGQGDVLVSTGGSVCNGNEVLNATDVIFVGSKQHYHPDTTAYYYAAGATGNGDGPCGALDINENKVIVHNVKNNVCPVGAICQDPKFVGVTVGQHLVPNNYDDYDVNLRIDSPAIDAGVPVSGFDNLDNVQKDRGSVWDLGAFEHLLCGNFIVNLGEECDDGNQVSGDGCSDQCIIEYCGDTIIHPALGEICDSNSQSCVTGNGYPGTQDCSSTCTQFNQCVTSLFCGDNVCTNPPENSTNCPQDCGTTCGNNVLEPGEQCDDGNIVSEDGCSSTCRNEYCGDSIVQAGMGEQCDDGNTTSGDGCSATCQAENSYYGLMLSYSPNRSNANPLGGQVNADDIYVFVDPEQDIKKVQFYLDDPTRSGSPRKTESYPPYDFNGTARNMSANPYDASSLSGPHNITAVVTKTNNSVEVIQANFNIQNSNPVCGNSLLETGEECDDGNTVSGDGCSNICKFEYCGDSVLQTALGEQCDDGNIASGDGCSASCLVEYCGDNVLQTALGEQCDDGNTSSGDGCSASCIVEYCGDNVLHTALGEQCDDGNNVSEDGCSGSCIVEYCGDNILQTGIGEQCDDGNQVGGDGCSASCQIETSIYELRLSYSPNRSNYVPLAGEVQGVIYVFTGPDQDVAQVKFYLDDPNLTGSPIKTENYAPYDFAGTNNGLGNPFDTASLSAGPHKITAAVKKTDNTTEVIHADFTVKHQPFFGTLQAENMPIKTVGGPISGGWNLWANGKIEQSVNFPTTGRYRFDVRAFGTFAGSELPNMAVLIDGQTKANVAINAGSWKTFTVEFDVSGGSHQVAIAFTNDYYAPPKDRNLYVDKVTITQP